MKFTQIKETCLYVEDLERTKAFYHSQLGFPIIGFEEGRHIFFRVGTSVLLCFISEETSQLDDLPPHYGQGKLHLAFEAPQQEYEKIKTEMEAQNIPIIHEELWGNEVKRKSFYFNDPDGHVLEVIEYGLWEA